MNSIKQIQEMANAMLASGCLTPSDMIQCMQLVVLAELTIRVSRLSEIETDRFAREYKERKDRR